MNGQDTFLWGLELNDALTTELTAQMTVIAFGVAVICFICSVAYNYLYHGVSQLFTPDENKFPDLMEIARCFALIFCLSLYTPISKTIVGTMEVINEATSLTGNRAQEFAQYMERSASEQQEMLTDYEKTALNAEVNSGNDSEGAKQKELDNISQDNTISGMGASLKKILTLLNPANWGAMIIHAIAALLIAAIQVIILGMGVVIIKVLVILGPFVFAFSILPVFQKQLSNWFGTLCSVGMVFTVINILNQIMWFTFKGIYNSDAFNFADEATKQLQYLGMDLAIIGSYCSCFWLSGKIVGHGDAGRIISKTVSIVTTAATMAIAGKVAAGGATNLSSAAAIGKNTMKNEN